MSQRSDARATAKKALLRLRWAAVVVLVLWLAWREHGYRQLWAHAQELSQDMTGVHHRAVRQAGHAAVPVLIRLVREGDSYQVVYAARLLAEFGDPRAVEPILDACYRHERLQHPDSAVLIGECLRKFGDEAARQVVARLRKGPELVSLAGVAAGAAAVPELDRLARIDGWNNEYFGRIVVALAQTGSPEAIDALLHLYGRLPGEVRAALVRIGKAGAARYVQLLKETKQQDLRRTLMLVVGDLEVREAIPVLVRVLSDESLPWQGQRECAVLALSKFPNNGQAELFFRLMERFRGERDYDAALAAVALGSEGDPRAEPLLRQFVDSRSGSLEMLYALGRCRAPGAIAFLLHRLETASADASVAGEARTRYTLKALGYTGDHRAAKAVLDWLTTHMPQAGRHLDASSSHYCFENAVWSLGELGGEEALGALERLKALESLGHEVGPRRPYEELTTEAIERIKKRARDKGAAPIPARPQAERSQ